LIHGNFLERLGRRYLYSGFRKAKKVITLSHFVEGLLVAKFRFHAQQLKVIPQGYDDRVFFPKDKQLCRQKLNLPLNSFIILSVAIESYRKNIFGLVEAFKIVSERIPNALLLRVGDRTEPIAKLMAELNLEDKIIYVSRGLNQSQLCEFYNASDLYACPSFYEGYVLTPLEAMACGTDVLVSNITSLEEVYGDYSIVVDPYDKNDMADKIIEFYNQETKVNRQRVKEFVSQRSWKHTAFQTYEEVYKPLLRSVG
jgi:glycosyltransferase involved in cell wall biosynthesis